jgi:hypothetical protein
LLFIYCAGATTLRQIQASKQMRHEMKMFMLPYGFSSLAASVREFAVRIWLIGCDVPKHLHFPHRPIASRALTLQHSTYGLDSEARTGPCRTAVATWGRRVSRAQHHAPDTHPVTESKWRSMLRRPRLTLLAVAWCDCNVPLLAACCVMISFL